MSDINSSTSFKFNLENLKNQVISQSCFTGDDEDTISIDGLHVRITKTAVREFFNKLFSKGSNIMRIAAGITVVKGIPNVTSTEIKQAVQMEEQGVHNYLPTEEW